MSRRTYEDEGADDDWNTVADLAFDPTSSEYMQTESLARRGRRGRGGGGRRARASGAIGGGRGVHPEGDIIAVTPRSRGVVSELFPCITPVPLGKFRLTGASSLGCIGHEFSVGRHPWTVRLPGVHLSAEAGPEGPATWRGSLGVEPIMSEVKRLHGHPFSSRLHGHRGWAGAERRSRPPMARIRARTLGGQ